MRNQFFAGLAVAALATSAMAEITASSGWEDITAPANFGTYGNVSDSGFSSDPVYAGNYSYFMTEDPLSGTPQSYVAWIRGLSEGDTVTVTMWMLGQSNGVDSDSKGRLWGHYTDEVDPASYIASASGPAGYAGEGGVWTQTTHTWTIAAGQTALMVEARIYSYGANNTIWCDDMVVTVSNDNATIDLAGSAVPAPGALALLGLAGLAGRRRR